MPALASFLFRKEAYRAALDFDLEEEDFDFEEVDFVCALLDDFADFDDFSLVCFDEA